MSRAAWRTRGSRMPPRGSNKAHFGTIARAKYRGRCAPHERVHQSGEKTALNCLRGRSLAECFFCHLTSNWGPALPKESMTFFAEPIRTANGLVPPSRYLTPLIATASLMVSVPLRRWPACLGKADRTPGSSRSTEGAGLETGCRKLVRLLPLPDLLPPRRPALVGLGTSWAPRSSDGSGLRRPPAL